MRILFYVTAFAAFASISIARSTPFFEVAFCTTTFVLLSSSIVLAILSRKLRWPAIIFSMVSGAYLVFAQFPDSGGYSPRRIGTELSTRLLRNNYSNLTGGADLDCSHLPDGYFLEGVSDSKLHKMVGEEPTSSVAAVAKGQLGRKDDPFAMDDDDATPSAREALTFDELQSLIESSIPDIQEWDTDLPLPANLSGLGPWIAFEENLQRYLRIGHCAIAVLLAFVIALTTSLATQALRRVRRAYPPR